ncbi:MAG: YtrH family sporulation protein [Clostridia bacterium]|nr:YtrH family sporulation protein [Clostridia bacterium]
MKQIKKDGIRFLQASFFSSVIYSFLVSFGVILGASIFAGIGAVISDHPPLKTMLDIAGSIKVWAVAVALGGTFSSFEIIEKGIFNGEMRTTLKQAVYVVMALFGANAGFNVIKLIQRCGEIWME